MGKMSKKDKKKRKKEKKHKSKEKKRKHVSHSSDSSGSEGEWVEEEAAVPQEAARKESDMARDEWMSMESAFGGKTRKELNEKKEKPEEKKEFNLLDKPGQSTRELNPYWKDGGTGLPPEKPSSSSEDSQEDSSSSQDEPSPRKSCKKSYSRRDSQSKSTKSSRHEDRPRSTTSSSWSSKPKFRRPVDDDDPLDSRKQSHHSDHKNYSSDKYKKLNFKKPGEESSIYRGYRSNESSYGRKNWKKPSSESDSQKESKSASERFQIEADPRSPEIPRRKSPEIEDTPTTESVSGVLTLNQMNELSASILKAELMGNKALAEELKGKLREARLRKEATVGSSSSEIYDEKGRKVVVLTETDARGFTRPAKSVEERGGTTSAGQKKKKRKADTHEGNSRVRYFPDDDKYSLNDMFEKEKYTTSDDQNATFLKLMSKEKRDDDMADEAAFDSARMDTSEKDDRRRRDEAIKKFTAKEKAIDTCRFCIGSKNASHESIVLTKDKVYLAVPTFQSLTEGHCLILPQNHVPCSTLLDEDVWEEIKDLRKNLVRVFEKEDEDIIFFESAMHIDKYPHMILHCVPVPREVGDTAPIYFKKAILECENEWTNNKKVVELAGRDVRKAVPKGLPYFAVDFGMQSGYAHVIEDKRLFPHNFAQEIIGGMLDLDHTIWRKNKRDTPENIKKKVDSLKKLIEANN